jgi:hypothetical protein
MSKSFVINEVRGPFTYKNKKTGKDITKIALNGKEDGDVVFMSESQVETKASVTRNFGVLVGSTVEVEHFEIGDKLHNGESCDKAGWIAKDIKIIKSPKLEMIAMAGEMGASLDLSKVK